MVSLSACALWCAAAVVATQSALHRQSSAPRRAGSGWTLRPALSLAHSSPVAAQASVGAPSVGDPQVDFAFGQPEAQPGPLEAEGRAAQHHSAARSTMMTATNAARWV